MKTKRVITSKVRTGKKTGGSKVKIGKQRIIPTTRQRGTKY